MNYGPRTRIGSWVFSQLSTKYLLEEYYVHNNMLNTEKWFYNQN
jgi:hypothetical protein